MNRERNDVLNSIIPNSVVVEIGVWSGEYTD